MERGIETGVSLACFNSVAPLPAFGVFAAAARVAAGAAFFVAVPFADVFTAGLAADFTLFFTVVLLDFAMAFVVAETVFDAGLDEAAVVVFAGAFAMVFALDFFAGVAAVLVFAADLPTLLAAALFVADLVTVAFIVSPYIETPETCPYYPRNLHPLFPGRPG